MIVLYIAYKVCSIPHTCTLHVVDIVTGYHTKNLPLLQKILNTIGTIKISSSVLGSTYVGDTIAEQCTTRPVCVFISYMYEGNITVSELINTILYQCLRQEAENAC